MASNRGNTSLKCKRRNEKPMLEFDRLPRELRVWIASADLPWRPRSVQKAFDRAMSKPVIMQMHLKSLVGYSVG